jgi:hypothetical protein
MFRLIRVSNKPVNGFAGQQLAPGGLGFHGIFIRLGQGSSNWTHPESMTGPNFRSALRVIVGTVDYRFEVPRTSFFTLRFAEPRAYSRGLSGVSVAFFLRAVRFAFLRSTLLSFLVFAMNPFQIEKN